METQAGTFFEKISFYDPEDREKIRNAVNWVSEISGENKEAALSAASVLLDLNLDAETVIAAIIQRSSEKGGGLDGRFGERAAALVRGVLEITAIPSTNTTLREAENIRKMLFAVVKDIRVILIKLADELYVMRTLDDVPAVKQKLFAQECLDIYAPIADRLGISWLKDELEDLSLKYLNREAYHQIKEIVSLKRKEREAFLSSAKDAVSAEAEKARIAVEVSSRAKHFYSIYQKMRKRNKGADELYDLSGMRILCDSVENCYTLLGIVHRLWKPVDGRFKDYIAMKKSNGYQSLHTTVTNAEGRLLEIQIRTREMHRTAEFGVASHWLYKKRNRTEAGTTADISLANRLRDWSPAKEDTHNAAGFLDGIKRDIFVNSIYVFTPRGKVIELPARATAIDFAYHIHTAVGEHCIGAKANGNIIPLGAELKNTQVVEILTSPSAHPHFNWLMTARTAKARAKIRSWLQENDDTARSEFGARKEFGAGKNPAAEKNTAAGKKPAEAVPPALLPEKTGDIQRVVRGSDFDPHTLKVRVEDEKNMLIRFARCCRPVSGDPITGYISRGRGIIIHRSYCANVRNIPDFNERKISVEWENSSPFLIKRFKVEARFSRNLFSELEGAVRKHRGHLIEGRLDETGSNHMTGIFTVEIDKETDVKSLLKSIRGIPSVFSVNFLH